jgi:hypothetical protein
MKTANPATLEFFVVGTVVRLSQQEVIWNEGKRT